MKEMPLSDLRRFGSNTIAEMCPITVTVDAEPKFVIDKLENVITLSDLHPRVQNMFRGMNQKVRKGMPKPERVWSKPYNDPDTDSAAALVPA